MLLSEQILNETGVCKSTRQMKKAMCEIAWLAWKEAAFKNYPKYNERFEKMNFIAWFEMSLNNND